MLNLLEKHFFASQMRTEFKEFSSHGMKKALSFKKTFFLSILQEALVKVFSQFTVMTVIVQNERKFRCQRSF